MMDPNYLEHKIITMAEYHAIPNACLVGLITACFCGDHTLETGLKYAEAVVPTSFRICQCLHYSITKLYYK